MSRPSPTMPHNHTTKCDQRNSASPDTDRKRPCHPESVYGLKLRSDLLERMELITAEYEDQTNQERAALNDGKRHYAFSCRDHSTDLTIPACVRFMLCMEAGDIHRELLNCRLFPLDNIPSEASFCKTRDKIPEASFEGLFHWFVDKYYWLDRPDCGDFSYRILAVDGSEAPYPANPDEPDNFVATRSDTKARNVIHVNACADTQRMMVVDLILQNAHAKDERSANYQFMERIATRFPNPDQRILNLFTTDRGYEAWNLPVLADHYGLSYLCRIKSEDSNGVLSGIKDLLPVERNSFDRVIALTLTRDSAKKRLPGYHYLGPSVQCELCTPGHDYPISIRVIKVRISDKVTEYLFTNLPKESVPKSLVVIYYHRRWPIESTFSLVKYPLCLLSPHGSIRGAVSKEIWCRFLMFDIVSAIVYHDGVPVEKKEDTGRKYDYTRDFSSSIADIRVFLLSDADYDIDAVVRKLIRPLRDKESRERHKTPRKPPSFGHRHG